MPDRRALRADQRLALGDAGACPDPATTSDDDSRCDGSLCPSSFGPAIRKARILLRSHASRTGSHKHWARRCDRTSQQAASEG
jgi:hypothetical protein